MTSYIALPPPLYLTPGFFFFVFFVSAGQSVQIPHRPSGLAVGAILSPALSSSLPSATVSDVLTSDLAQLVQRLEKENVVLKESLRRAEDHRIKAELKSRQVEARCSKLESALSLLQANADPKHQHGNEPPTSGEGDGGQPGEGMQPQRSLLTMELSRARQKDETLMGEGESSRDEPTNQKTSDPGSFEGGIPMKIDSRNLYDSSQEDLLDSFLSADGARLLAEGIDWLKQGAGDLEDVLQQTPAGHFTQNFGKAGTSAGGNSGADYQFLAKKYVILHDELYKLRESYRNQGAILAECEKKLEEALNDKAEVIQAKVDVLKLQSVYGLTWVPDDCVKECLQCGYVFTFFARQHHCRLCGRLFCANCTTNTCPIPSLGYDKPVRVCDHW